jgi:adenosylmethionine-8-amino-7-oxononanoate aminotransferase
MKKAFFITGTDTGVGKTVVTAALGILLQKRGYQVGVMKPVQCAGHDAKFLKSILEIEDPLSEINPCFAPEPLSPHLAFKRSHKNIDIKRIKTVYKKFITQYDIVLIEGAGGLLVPLQKDYLVADLIRELDVEVVIVSRLGLGTINHTLLTVRQAQDCGLLVKGVIFSDRGQPKGLPEKTNPQAIQEIGRVPVLGTLPFIKKFTRSNISKAGQNKIKLNVLLEHQESSTQLLQSWDKQYVWHPFTQMKDWLLDHPLVIDRAEGSYVIDADGKRYIDGVSSLWVNVHGHRKRVIDQAIKKQINQLSHSTLLGLANTPSIQLAKELVDITPQGLTKVFYSDSGSEAVEIAVKMAYQYWQNIGRKRKTKIAHLANSYHGDTLGSVSVGGISLFHQVYKKLVIKTIQVDFPDCYRAPVGKRYPDYAFEHVARFEKLLKAKHQEIAAFVLEPLVQGAAGMIMWPKGILKQFHQICQKYDVLLIADEVATGFGRTGTMFACEQEQVNPDILCVAKGLTGGYLPLAATLTTKRIFDGFLFDYKDQKTFFHGHTYTGNPLACAAALANLQIFRKENTLKHLAPKIKHLDKRLKLFYNLRHVGQIRQKGFMVGIELVEDRESKRPFPWQARVGVRVCQQARKHGVILRPLGNVIVLMPPLSITINELNDLLDATYASIREVTES